MKSKSANLAPVVVNAIAVCVDEQVGKSIGRCQIGSVTGQRPDGFLVTTNLGTFLVSVVEYKS